MASRRKKKRSPRRKKESRARRLGRVVNRFLIAVTLLLIAAYLIPFSSRILDNSEDTAFSATGKRVTVQVLNGCGERGLALDVTRFLRANGCDVVEMGNASHFHHNVTRIIAKNGNIEDARIVRDALGIGEISSDPDSTLLLDVTVLIGSDYVPFSPADGISDGRDIGTSR